MTSWINYDQLPSNPKLASQALDFEKQDKELERKLWKIGKIFWHWNNVSLYIVALIIIFLILIGLTCLFVPIKWMTSKELRETLAPFITAWLGFVAGKTGELKT